MLNIVQKNIKYGAEQMYVFINECETTALVSSCLIDKPVDRLLNVHLKTFSL